MLGNALSGVWYFHGGEGGGGGGESITPMPAVPLANNKLTPVQCVLQTQNLQISKYKLLKIFVPPQFFGPAMAPQSTKITRGAC